MSLDVFFREEIRNVLHSAEYAKRTALQATADCDDEYKRGYAAGYEAALITVALAFGLVTVASEPAPSRPPQFQPPL